MKQTKGEQRDNYIPEPLYPCLPSSWCKAIIVACCLIAFGLQTPPLHIMPHTTDPLYWPQTWDGWFERGMLFLFTFYLMLKQTDYYYGWLNWSSKSGLFKAIGWANTWEVVSDYALGFWGACLFAISGLWPYLWLPAFTLYCLLGWLRCRLSLARGRTSRRRKVRYDKLIITRVFSLAPFDMDFDKLGESIEGMHKAPGHEEVSKKAVLAGWIWSFSLYGCITAVCSICTRRYGWIPLRMLSAIDTALAITILFFFSGVTSGFSQRWGEKHFNTYTH